MGALSNIDEEGFPSAAFHSYPQNLRWDTYTGDYGPNFFGHAVTTGTYVINHPEYGWQAFGGNVTTSGGSVTVQTLDSLRRRIYIAPLGLYLTLDAGTFESVTINPATRAVRLTLSPCGSFHAERAAAHRAAREGHGHRHVFDDANIRIGTRTPPSCRWASTPTVVELTAR